MSSVYQAFANTAARVPDNAFLHIPASACSEYSPLAIDVRYSQMLAEVDAHAKIYQQHGYKPGLRVALMLENRPDFFVHWLALNKLACSVVPISTDSQVEDVQYFIDHAEVATVIGIDDKFPNSIHSHSAVEPSLNNLSPLSDALSKPVAEDSECALLYTSGSTGKPKGCILINEYFTFAGEWYTELGGLAELEWGKERLLTPLPLTHMNAMAVSAMAMIASGGCLIQLDRFHPQTWWQSVRESAATAVHYLGVLPAILLEMPPSDGDDFRNQIKFGFGAGVNPQHHARFEERFGFPLLEAWAMTESGVGGSIIANHEPRHIGNSCFGKAPDYIEYQLVDEQKKPVPQGADGELRVRAKGDNPARGFFAGYLKNDAATAETWQDGWLNTGDVVREDEQGNLYFVGRRKNVIRRSGENISALEVEACLSQHPFISEVIACAVPDELRGDEVAACIVLSQVESNLELISENIVNHAMEKLAYFKAPGYIIVYDDLPKTASNKPRRGDIKAMARASVASGDAFDTRAMKKRVSA